MSASALPISRARPPSPPTIWAWKSPTAPRTLFISSPISVSIRSATSRARPADQTAAFEVSERADLEAAAAELERLGHRVRFGTAEEAELRQVRSFIAFQDPTGNNIELVWRPAMSSRRYHGERDAGITGFSHIGLCTTDAARDEAVLDQGLQRAGQRPDRRCRAAAHRRSASHHRAVSDQPGRHPAHQSPGRDRATT